MEEVTKDALGAAEQIEEVATEVVKKEEQEILLNFEQCREQIIKCDFLSEEVKTSILNQEIEVIKYIGRMIAVKGQGQSLVEEYFEELASSRREAREARRLGSIA